MKVGCLPDIYILSVSFSRHGPDVRSGRRYLFEFLKNKFIFKGC